MIKDIIDSKNISIYALAKKIGVPYSTLNDIVSGKTAIENISAELLYKLSCGLDMTMEALYLGKLPERTIFLYNEGRTVYVQSDGFEFQYTGPKNLVAFKKLNRFIDGCAYVDTYFQKKNGEIYIEEDYVDIGDLCEEYGEPTSILDNVKIQIGKPGDAKRERLIDEAIIVSDYMAVRESGLSADSMIVEVTSVARTNSQMQLRLKDYAVLSTNMSSKMQKRAIDVVRRNIVIIEKEIEKRSRYA